MVDLALLLEAAVVEEVEEDSCWEESNVVAAPVEVLRHLHLQDYVRCMRHSFALGDSIRLVVEEVEDERRDHKFHSCSRLGFCQMPRLRLQPRQQAKSRRLLHWLQW